VEVVKGVWFHAMAGGVTSGGLPQEMASVKGEGEVDNGGGRDAFFGLHLRIAAPKTVRGELCARLLPGDKGWARVRYQTVGGDIRTLSRRET